MGSLLSSPRLDIGDAERLERVRARRQKIGHVLLTHRKALGITIEACSRLIAVRRQTYSLIESGQASIELPLLEILMDALEVRTDEIWPTDRHEHAGNNSNVPCSRLILRTSCRML